MKVWHVLIAVLLVAGGYGVARITGDDGGTTKVAAVRTTSTTATSTTTTEPVTSTTTSPAPVTTSTTHPPATAAPATTTSTSAVQPSCSVTARFGYPSSSQSVRRTGTAHFFSNQPSRPAVFWLAHNGYVALSIRVDTNAKGDSGQMEYNVPDDPPGTVYEVGVTFDMDAWAAGGHSRPPEPLCRSMIQS